MRTTKPTRTVEKCSLSSDVSRGNGVTLGDNFHHRAMFLQCRILASETSQRRGRHLCHVDRAASIVDGVLIKSSNKALHFLAREKNRSTTLRSLYRFASSLGERHYVLVNGVIDSRASRDCGVSAPSAKVRNVLEDPAMGIRRATCRQWLP